VHLGNCERDAEYLRTITRRGVCSVRGNCDYSDTPEERVLNVGGKRIFLTHGHRQHVKMSLDRIKLLGAAERYDAVLFGHTHQPEVFYYEGVLFLNPGSMSANRDGSGISYARIQWVDGELYPEIEYLKW
jgi:putative phosphoesterase